MVYRVVINGGPGCYSHQAVEQCGARYGIRFEIVHTTNFKESLRATKDDTHLAMLPVGNSTGGVVSVANFLVKEGMRIVAEEFVSIEQCLLGHEPPGELVLRGKTAYTHPESIKQVGKFLEREGLVAAVHPLAPDNALAAEHVAKLHGPEMYNTFAIAGRKAAETYGLMVLKENIMDNPNNTTKFWLVRPAKSNAAIDNAVLGKGGLEYKATLAFDISPTDLGRLLDLVTDKKFSPVNLHSAPGGTTGGPFGQLFYFDLHFDTEMKSKFPSLLTGLKGLFGESMSLLGLYHPATLPNTGD